MNQLGKGIALLWNAATKGEFPGEPKPDACPECDGSGKVYPAGVELPCRHVSHAKPPEELPR